jgi:ATP-binding cassette subfamily C (CFTR/MRP) protein 1
MVLKNISLKIKSGEKIGIIGRTGAGKSSLVLALLRLFELKAGNIFIDGTDITRVKLDVLRKSLAILP